MRHEQKEALSHNVFACHAANNSVKTTVNYLKRTNKIFLKVLFIIYRKKTKDLPRSARSVKLSTKDLNTFVKSVNNRCDRSQHQLG